MFGRIADRIRRRTRTFTTTPVGEELLDDLNHSQGMIEGFDLASYQDAHVCLIGAGGIGSHVASALVRKGIGELTLIDDDVVEWKNLTRQLFDREDVNKWKAVQLGKRLSQTGLFDTRLTCMPRRLQELQEMGCDLPDDAIFVGGVDNNPSRRAVAELGLMLNRPALLAAVSGDGNRAYVMVQEPGQACWGCAFPQYLDDHAYPCNVPGIVDVLQIVGGLVVFAMDSLISGRHREWNVREITLDGSMPDRSRHVARKLDCPVCGEAVSADPVSSPQTREVTADA